MRTDIDVEEIHHFPKPDAVDEISDRAAKDQCQGKNQGLILDRGSSEIVQNQQDRGYGHGQEEKRTEQG